MNANDVIESYVADVAVQLPRKQGNDVAFELRALLHEELQANAEAAGRAADAAMALELARAFGRPEDVAARYRPTLTIIDPADGRNFLRATVIGLAIIWAVGLWANLRPLDSPWDLLTVLGQWWTGTVIPSPWWPGVLVVGYGLAAWSRRRSPQKAEWQPRSGERVVGSRVGLLMGLLGFVCGVSVLVEPRWVLDFFWGGRAAPAAYEALTYTETFRHRQGPLLLLLFALNFLLLIAVLVRGRWSVAMQRLQTGISVAACAAMIWTVLDGPVLVGPSGDRAAKSYLVLIVVVTLIIFALQLRRSVRPAPGRTPS